MKVPAVDYKDQIHSIETVSDHSVLLYVPQLFFKMFFDSKIKEQKVLEKFLYENLPSLSDYTNSYMTRLLPCFQEQVYEQNSTIFKASRKL